MTIRYDKHDLHSSNMDKWAASHNARRAEFSLGWGQALAHEQQQKHGCRYHMIHADSTQAAAAFADAKVGDKCVCRPAESAAPFSPFLLLG